MLDEKDMTATPTHAPVPVLRDEEGALRPEFVERVQ